MHTGSKVCENASTRGLQKKRIGSLLPALANTVVDQWSDTKDAVRLEAMECALVISRISTSADLICSFVPVQVRCGELAWYRCLSLKIS